MKPECFIFCKFKILLGLCTHYVAEMVSSSDTLKTEIVGACRLFADGKVSRVVVHPSYQSKGIGTMVMRSMEKHAVEKLKMENLYVEAYNPVVPYYERLGYTVVAGAPPVKISEDVVCTLMEKRFS